MRSNNGGAKGGSQRVGAKLARGNEQKRKRSPHAKDAKQRRLDVVLPSVAWQEAFRKQAKEWDLRTADVVVYAFSLLMQGIESGEIERPRGSVEFHHRAGEGLDLPWRPESGVTVSADSGLESDWER